MISCLVFCCILQDLPQSPIRIIGESVQFCSSPQSTEIDSINSKILYKRNVSDVKFEIVTTYDEIAEAGELDGVNQIELPTSQKVMVDAIAEKTDLIPGKYEGLKTWECSIDLVHYLMRQPQEFIQSRRVLELGCGSALPSLYCLTQLASHVDLADYNSEVLQLVTIPNVLLNTVYPPSSDEIDQAGYFEKEVILSKVAEAKCRFFYGDWETLPHNLKYDLILTSETIYHSHSQPKLYNVIKKLLKPGGIALIATKTLYFGVGGGIRDFESLIQRDGLMKSRVVGVYDENVRREIVEVSWR
ncbi:S-adenosyl-L-methionine-dependent methyltransferase [Paraphysoderma sedebokerense]|nr:S-adenosyl-L-methionine-dependent methyltransferase [Paraphysoderma sedebokerense]